MCIRDRDYKLSEPDAVAVNAVFEELEFRRIAENFKKIFTQNEKEASKKETTPKKKVEQKGQQFDLFAPPGSGILKELKATLLKLENKEQKTLLLGVSYALLDLIEFHQFELKHSFVMETGGMKGRRKELIKSELHTLLKKGFGVKSIHSEYGMTELLSQAYSKGDGMFSTPPWMQVLVRDTEDALTILPKEKTGGINVIDLANVHSCSFIATQDLGKIHKNGQFEVLGRFDQSDVRGCNLMLF